MVSPSFTKGFSSAPQTVFKVAVAAKGKKSTSWATSPLSCGEDSFCIISQNRGSLISAHVAAAEPDTEVKNQTNTHAAFKTEGSNVLMAVADGVGGWGSEGVDPSIMSRQTMITLDATAFPFFYAEAQMKSLNLRNIFWLTYMNLLESKRVELGSTTVSFNVLTHDESGNPMLRGCNLGDSGWVVVRKGEIVSRSRPQVTSNAPNQLAVLTPEYIGTSFSHSPNDADIYDNVSLQEGDVVVLATDGLWDNIDNRLLQQALGSNPAQQPENAAKALLNRALTTQWKMDDITIIVAAVQKKSAETVAPEAAAAETLKSKL